VNPITIRGYFSAVRSALPRSRVAKSIVLALLATLLTVVALVHRHSTTAVVSRRTKPPGTARSESHIRKTTGEADGEALARVARADTAIEGSIDWDDALRTARRRATDDPAGAFAWASMQSDPERRGAALTAVCYGLAENEPERALGFAREFQLDRRGGELIADIVQQWAVRDLPAAISWAAIQSPGAEREQILTRIALVQSRSNPTEAARLVVAQITSEAPRNEAAMMVLHQWAKRDLSGAIAWVGRFSDGPMRERALDELAGISASPDASGAQR
jgi:hypothetical protein